MPASRASGVVVAALLAGLAAPAAAQPVELQRRTPLLVPERPQPPERPAPRPPPAADPDAPLRPQLPLARDDIVVDELDRLSPDGFGPLDERRGGLPTTLWRDTPWDTVRTLLPRLPGRTTSAAMRALASRLLRSLAVVPADKPQAESYLGLRAGRLLAMADVAGAVELMQAVPAQDRDETFLKTRIEALFLANRNGDACAEAAAVAVGGAYWKQVESFCLALDGHHADATLIAELLSERERGIEPAYFAAIDALAEIDRTEVGSLGEPSGLILAMMRAANLRLPATVAADESPVVLRWVARAPNADVDVRLEAAEKALALGAMTPEELIGLYAQIPFLERELADPIAQAQTGWGARGRALLLAAAAAGETPTARAETLRQGWALARDKGGFATLSHAGAAVVATIAPQPELMWFARNAARALLAAGRVDAALAWYAAARAERDTVEEAQAAEADLWPLALLARRSEALPLDRLRGWYGEARAADAAGAARRAAALLALLAATGREVPAAAWRIPLDGPLEGPATALGPAWHHSLAAAAAAGRIGETALLAGAAATAADGRAYEATAAAAAAVRALDRVGLTADAGRLALESALAAGL